MILLFRRLLTLLVAIQIFAFGSLQVMAEESTNPPITQTQESETESIQKDTEQTQSTDATVNQNQTIKTDAHNSVEQGQVVVEVISQEQTPNTDDSIEQTQTSTVKANQSQDITNADELNAAQDQKAAMKSSQSQQVSTSEENPETQEQQTTVATDQKQDLSIEGNTSIARQAQSTNIETTQQSETNNEDNGDDLGQKTKVELQQETALTTSGTGTINQTQSAEASGEIKPNGDKPAFSLKVFVENGLEIIKDGAGTVIKVLQRIKINEDTFETFENEYLLDNSKNGNVQEYTKTYDWGTLNVLNKAMASILGDGDVEAFMESIISFDYVLGKPIIEDIVEEETGNDNGNNNEEENATNNEDYYYNNNEEEDNATNNEENRPYSYVKTNSYNNKINFINYIKSENDSSIVWKLDSDNDGISDYLEIFKFKTDPFTPDTNGNGLSDLYEVAYHDANQEQNFQIINLTKQERFNYLLQMNW